MDRLLAKYSTANHLPSLLAFVAVRGSFLDGDALDVNAPVTAIAPEGQGATTSNNVAMVRISALRAGEEKLTRTALEKESPTVTGCLTCRCSRTAK